MHSFLLSYQERDLLVMTLRYMVSKHSQLPNQ